MTAMRQRTTVGRRAGRRRSGSHEPVRREVAPALPLESERHLEEPAEPSATELQVPYVDPEPGIEPPGAESPPLEHEWVEPEPAEVETVAPEPVDESVEESVEVSIEERADEPDEEPASEPTPLAKKAAARRKPRPSVPSWDDIMFGAKRD
jgi:hypothetical protein